MGDLEKLQRAVAGLAKQKGRGVGRVIVPGRKARPSSEVTEVISTGVDVIDRWVIGCGGWPVGRVSELFASENVGKTSLLWRSFATVQRAGGSCVLVDSERSIDPAWAAVHGCDVDRMLVLEPRTFEEALSGIEAALRSLSESGGPHLVAWDSLAAAPPAEEFEGAVGESKPGLRARLLNQGFRKIGPLVSPARAHLLIVNQMRQAIGAFAGGSVAPGGAALKHLSSVRLKLGVVSKGEVKEHGQQTGYTVKAQAWKNRHAPSWRAAEVRLMYETGWDDRWATIELAKERELIGHARRVGQVAHAEALRALGWPTTAAEVPESAESDPAPTE